MSSSTRRSFLKTSAALAAALPFTRLPLSAAIAAASPPDSKRGLLFDPADLNRIRSNTRHPRFQKLWRELADADLADDTDFLSHRVRFNNHVADMMRVRQILERTAFVYAIGQSPAQLKVARLAIQKLTEYPKWDYFLEGGKTVMGLQRAPEATIAMAFALDWLGDALSVEEQSSIRRQIATKGAPACFTTLYGLKYPDRVKGWGFDPEDDYPYHFDLRRWPLILNATNLKVIPTAALGIAAVVLQGHDPQADHWLELARSSARAFSSMYGADGAYDEGVSYWGYTTLHLALFAEVLWRRRGIDDRSLINYPGTVRYALVHTMPTKGEGFDPAHGPRTLAVPTMRFDPAYDIVNFGDALSTIDVSVAAWVARTHHDPVSQYVAKEIGDAKFSFGLIWFDPATPAEPPPPALMDVRLSNDLVISRTGWTVDDTVLAFRSGGPANHEHADRNSVIFKAHGERLFHDPFRAGYSPTLERWKLRQTSAHTAVLINGRGHQYHDGSEGTNSSWAWARVQQYRADPQHLVVTSDATEAYALVDEGTQQVERTLVFLKPEVLLILDRIRLKVAQPVQLRFQVFNDDNRGTVTAEANGFSIQRPFASLKAQVYSARGAVTCAATRLDLPEDEGVFPLAEAVSAAATQHDVLTVATAAPKGEAHGAFSVSSENGVWSIKGSHRGRSLAASITVPASGLPVVTL
jgi:hypothetical protein